MESHSALGQTYRSLESQALAVMGGVGPLIPAAGGNGRRRLGKALEREWSSKVKLNLKSQLLGDAALPLKGIHFLI